MITVEIRFAGTSYALIGCGEVSLSHPANILREPA